jgi:hypothetical protein
MGVHHRNTGTIMVKAICAINVAIRKHKVQSIPQIVAAFIRFDPAPPAELEVKSITVI